MAQKNPPNRGGKGPAVRSQGKTRGPITSEWHLNQGSNGSSKAKVAPAKPGASPSKDKGGWYLGSKKGPASHKANPG